MLTWDIPVYDIAATGIVTVVTILASFHVAKRETARAIGAQSRAERRVTASEVVAVLSELSPRHKRLTDEQRTRWLAALARVRTSERLGSEVAMWLDGVLRSYLARDQSTLTMLDRNLVLGPEALYSQVDIALARWIEHPGDVGMSMWGGVGRRTAAAMARAELRELRPLRVARRRVAAASRQVLGSRARYRFDDGH